MFEKLNPTDRLDDIMGDLDSAISAAKNLGGGGGKFLFC